MYVQESIHIEYTHFVYVHCTCFILHMSVITQYGNSALIRAAMKGNTEVVVALVKAKSDLDLPNNVCAP